MSTSVPVPGFTALAVALLVGGAAGIGGYTFLYAKGDSYLTDDPRACANCHVMQGHYDAWAKGPHHAAATCNDCHTPANPVGKYFVKALNGYSHSSAFTSGDYPDVIRIKGRSRDVVEAQCRHCHADMIAAMGGDGVECTSCHASVGHLK
ncbi:MAG: cytochrome c-type protein [Anaeromyxobacteraceae bacterium]|jgi:cytochrome c nitrite reductase small subunit|nr:cytochrome c-type protein [Anaeromyxobacteraceae bacterium]